VRASSAIAAGAVLPTDAYAGRMLTDRVYDLLKEEILRVERRPGDLLSEADLAARYGVSKTPVREALRLLARDGLVIVLPRKGCMIRPLRLDDIGEIFSIRALLEPTVAAHAATTAGPEDVARLRSLVNEQASLPDDLGRALQIARKFHLALVELGGNSRMHRVITDLVDEVLRLHFLLPNVDSHITSRDELRAHQQLVEALAAGDGERASEVMRVHLNEVAHTLVRGFAGL
jgi:GntR family transcriptional regulator, rspAB operon transcriptional repressor